MGTTAEKLSYLNETKTQIKNALETPSNTFRDYPTLIKKYINNQPTKIVTDGICNNAVELPIVSLGADGNSEQKITKGKQLFNKDNPDFSAMGSNSKYVSTKNGFKIVCNKNETTYSGSTFKIRLGNINDFIGTLRIKTTATVSGNGTFRPGLVLFYGNANNFNDSGKVAECDGNYGGITNFDIESNITEQSDFTHLYLVVYGNSSGSAEHYMNDGDYTIYDNFIITLNNEDMTYEQYTGGAPSPNPDYPQDIEVIDGCNRFYLKREDFTVIYGWAFTTQSRSIILKPNTEYTLYTNSPNGNDNIANCDILFGGTRSSDYGVSSNNPKTMMSDNDGNIPIYIRQTNIDNFFNGTNYIEIVEGISQKPYLPYGYIGLKQSGKNFANVNNIPNNKIIRVLNNKIILSNNSSLIGYISTSITLKQLCPDLKVGDNVTLSFENTSLSDFKNSIYLFGAKIKWDKGTAQVINQEMLDSNIIVYGGYEETAIISKFLIRLSQNTDVYEPYHEPKTIPIDLQGNTLARVGDTKDKLIIHRNDEVEIEKNTWKDTINTSSLITLNNGNKGLVFVTSKNKKESMSDSDYLITNAQRNRTFNDGTVYQNPANFVFVGNSSDTLETVKSKFNGGEILYQLKTPQIIKLPNIDVIELWQGTNIFKLITNLDTDFEVEYVVDKDSVLDEVQTAMLDAEIEI